MEITYSRVLCECWQFSETYIVSCLINLLLVFRVNFNIYNVFQTFYTIRYTRVRGCVAKIPLNIPYKHSELTSPSLSSANWIGTTGHWAGESKSTGDRSRSGPAASKIA